VGDVYDRPPRPAEVPRPRPVTLPGPPAGVPAVPVDFEGHPRLRPGEVEEPPPPGLHLVLARRRGQSRPVDEAGAPDLERACRCGPVAGIGRDRSPKCRAARTPAVALRQGAHPLEVRELVVQAVVERDVERPAVAARCDVDQRARCSRHPEPVQDRHVVRMQADAPGRNARPSTPAARERDLDWAPAEVGEPPEDRSRATGDRGCVAAPQGGGMHALLPGRGRPSHCVDLREDPPPAAAPASAEYGVPRQATRNCLSERDAPVLPRRNRSAAGVGRPHGGILRHRVPGGCGRRHRASGCG
jgi:hypothetical protein